MAMNVLEPLEQRLERAPGYVELLSGKLPTEEETARFIARHTLSQRHGVTDYGA